VNFMIQLLMTEAVVCHVSVVLFSCSLCLFHHANNHSVSLMFFELLIYSFSCHKLVTVILTFIVCVLLFGVNVCKVDIMHYRAKRHIVL